MSWKLLILLIVFYLNSSMQQSDGSVKHVGDILLEGDDLDELFEDFVTKFKKSYSDNVYRSRCKESFRKRHMLIKQHNEKYSNGEQTYKMGYNWFTDLPDDDFQKLFGYLPHIDDQPNFSNTQKEKKSFFEKVLDFVYSLIKKLIAWIIPSSNSKRQKRSLFDDSSEEIFKEGTKQVASVLKESKKFIENISKVLKKDNDSASDLGIIENIDTDSKKNSKSNKNANPDKLDNDSTRTSRTSTTNSDKNEEKKPTETTIRGDNVFQKFISPTSTQGYRDVENSGSRRKRDVTTGEIPASMDWRKKRAVTPVIDQKTCQGCWSFSVVSTLETHYFINNQKLYQLSSQQILDCAKDYNSNGCNQGSTLAAYDYLKENGTGWESKYPFTHKTGICHDQNITKRVKIATYKSLQNEEEILRVVGTIGPVSVGLDASNLPMYESGIYQYSNCGTTVPELNHAVSLVGYGTFNGTDYWICKNSWGSEWGEKGYFRMIRGQNMCGVGLIGRYPIL